MENNQNIRKVSRLRPGKGKVLHWQAPNGTLVELPVILDLKWINEETDQLQFHCAATIELVNNEPRMTHIELGATDGLVPPVLQSAFRWQTPLDVIRMTVPELLIRGLNPYEHDYAVDGYPNAASLDAPIKQELTDDFLQEIAQEYLAAGRGYAKKMANERGVTERTVVSWIQKARKKNILSSTKKGKAGGTLVDR